MLLDRPAPAIRLPGFAAAALDLIERRPWHGFLLFAALHGVVWTLLPALLYANLPLDLIEALTYGREWQLGYDKLPPLPWWLAEIVYRATGADTGFYVMSQVAVLTAFALIWAMARPIVGPLGALVSILIIDGLHYFNYTAPKFNHDVIELPVWALAGVSFHAALRRGRMRHWILLGLALGLALWAKYFVVMLAAPMALFLLIDRDARKALATPGPYVAAALALAVAAPHLAWLVQNDFLPFSYAAARATPPSGALDHLLRPLLFLGGQIGWAIPAGLIALELFHPPRDTPPARVDPFDRRIVAWLAFGPAALLIVASAITGRTLIAMWGYPLWLFAGLWIVIASGAVIARDRAARVVTVWSMIAALYVVALIADYTVLPFLDNRYRASLFPGTQLAREVSTRFRTATGAPLTYTVATMWLGGNVSRYTPERPRTLIDGRPERAPWIDLADLKRRGAAVIWTDGDPSQVPEAYREIAPGAVPQAPLDLPMRWGLGTVRFGWAILPPAR